MSAGTALEIYPAHSGGDYLIRVEFFGDEIDRIAQVDPLSGEAGMLTLEHIAIFPASHYVVSTGKDKYSDCDNT